MLERKHIKFLLNSYLVEYSPKASTATLLNKLGRTVDALTTPGKNLTIKGKAITMTHKASKAEKNIMSKKTKPGKLKTTA